MNLQLTCSSTEATKLAKLGITALSILPTRTFCEFFYMFKDFDYARFLIADYRIRA